MLMYGLFYGGFQDEELALISSDPRSRGSSQPHLLVEEPMRQGVEPQE